MLSDNRLYTPKKRRKYTFVHPRTLGILLLAVSIGVMLVYAYRQDSSSSFLTRLVLSPVSMVQTARTAAAAKMTEFSYFFANRGLLEEMKAEIDQLRRENVEYRYKLRQLDSYREALRFPHDEEFPGVTAIVVLWDNRLTDSMIINRGKADGVAINQPVYTSEGLIGRTYRSTEHFSKVQPLTDPACKIGVYIENTAYEGILAGTGDRDRLLLSDLRVFGDGDETVAPEPGQKVLTSGTGMVFPRNLLAGAISDATAEKGFWVEPVVDIKTVRSVIVLTSSTLREEMLSLLAAD